MMLCDGNWRRYVGRADLFHLLTVATLDAVLDDGLLRPRSQRVSNDYSRDSLVRTRRHLILDGGVPLVECVPFYLHPLQPMFVDLRRRGRVAAEEVLALAIDSSRLPGLLTYSTNPAYEGSHRISSVGNMDCDPTVYECWGWRQRGLSYLDNDLRMKHRQGESLFRGSVALDAICTVIGPKSPEFADVLARRYRRQVVAWDTDLTVFLEPCSHRNEVCPPN